MQWMKVALLLGLAVILIGLATLIAIPAPTDTSNGGISSNGCVVAGCSGQLCIAADEAADIITTCEYRAEYACYKSARCELQQNGTCGWSQTAELRVCLANTPALNAGIEAVY